MSLRDQIRWTKTLYVGVVVGQNMRRSPAWLSAYDDLMRQYDAALELDMTGLSILSGFATG